MKAYAPLPALSPPGAGCVLLLAAVCAALGGPPAAAQSVRLPAELKVAPGRLAALTVEWEGEDVRWDVPADLDVFREYDPDPRKVRLRVIGYSPGAYRIVAVAAKAGKLSDFAACVVRVGGTEPKPPDKPPAGGVLYFAVIRPEGPASPAFSRVMGDPAWATLKQRGHVVKDFTPGRARELRLPVPATLPAVLTLRVSADGRRSTLARPGVPLPTTSDAILQLAEGL
jgi:virulence-associated protein VagC